MKQIPNIMTLANAALGLYAVYTESSLGVLLIGLAMLLDLGDGLVARMLNAQNPLGVQLDSMADLISFGVAPAYLVYVGAEDSIVLVAGIFYSLSALYRLAKFNTLEYSSEFVGLPSPAAAGLICGVLLITDDMSIHMHWMCGAALVIGGFLMNAPIEFFSLKGKSLVKDWRIWFVVVGILIALVIDSSYAVFVGFSAYIFVSLLMRLLGLLRK